MNKLSKAQHEAMKQIYKVMVQSAVADRITNLTASDLFGVSLATLGSLQTKGMLKSHRGHGSYSFPRVCVSWRLTDEGMTYCKENFGS